MTERKLVPHIRFKGFKEEWEIHKFEEDILSIHTGTNILSSEEYGGIPLIKMGNLRNGHFDFLKLEYLPTNKKVDEKYKIRYGDFLFNTRNTLELVGKGATWMFKSNEYAFNNNIARFNFKKSINTIFFNYLYNTKKTMKQIHARATGTTSVAAIYPRYLDSVSYEVPNIKEQQKIGNLFAKLDRLLDLQQQKLDQLELLKKVLLQKLFPKQEAKIPELRFKGFEDEWVRTRIKNIVQYSSSSFSISELKENNEDNTYPVYDATGTKYYSKKFDMHDDYIAIIKDGSNVGKTRLLPAKSSVLSTMGYLKALNSNILFDFYSITNTNFDKYKVGSGIPHIYFSDYKKECKLVPKIPEQQKIGNLFAKIDRLIELENKKFSNLKLVKKSLLQNMFVE